MLVNLRNLRRIRVDDVAVPRAEIVAVSEHATLDEIVAVFQSSASSRLPVYAETLDQPVGLVHLKDLALKYGFGAAGRRLRPAGAAAAAALCAAVDADRGAAAEDAGGAHPHGAGDRRVRRGRRAGHDRGPARADRRRHRRRARRGRGRALEPARRRGSTWRRRGWTSTTSRRRRACRLVEPELAEEVDTLGGLVIRLAGRLPARGEVVAHPDGHEFEVVDADARRIKRLRVRLKAGADAAGRRGGIGPTSR